MLNFNFSEKCPGLVSPPLCMTFQEKCFTCYVLLTDKFSFSDAFTFNIMGNNCITIVCCPSYDVIKFEINLDFLIKPSCYIPKKPRRKSKYLENEKSF